MQSLRKRLVLAGLTAILVGSPYLTAHAATANAPTGQRLRNLAGNFLIGYAAMSNFNTASDSAKYQEVARTEFNFVTPENAMKWDATEPSQNNFTFGGADQLVNFAQANNQKIHGHTLVWHAQTPDWVTYGNWNSSTLTNVMYNHIDKVMNHWSDGQIYAWDVVNEAFEWNGTRRASVFQNVIGNSYIELAFRRARAADPVTKLIYNDYGIETVNSKSTGVYNMIADFKSRGVPIDGVGLQMHLSGTGIDYNSLAQNMQRFANIGVEVYITEMDVGISSTSSSNLTAQANVYSNVLARCKAQPMCKALQVWGIPDKYSWRTEHPLLFDDNYNAKPAYYAIQAGIGNGTTPTNTAVPTATRTAVPTATRTAVPTTVPGTATPVVPTSTPVAGAGCQVSYVLNQWGTGFTAEVTVKNTSTNAINGWALAWTFGGNQQVTNAWNATISPASGSVVASNVSYNASIPAGGSVSFGFQGSYSGTNSVPASFTLNGTTCSGS
ncbi:endo-1,4-beta-xylanase [Chloroflexia bacterium SDU3-3]|nr:endo-1,4-beta-xylanase [Chloroflexia bacterium SDU3-3]